MNRRTFITGSATAGLGLAALASARGAETAAQQLMEFRTYHFASPEKQAAFEAFLKTAAIPALNRAGVKPVGVFKLLAADNPKLTVTTELTDLFVLLPYPGVESLLTLAAKLDKDAEYQAAGKAILGVEKTDPAFTRIESSLMLAFDQCPQVETPSTAETRVLQLRIYESHNDDRALRKIEMFNEGGEIALFRKLGMNPVFFGQTLAGSKVPNLTYMLGFDSDAKREEAWKAFMGHPEWAVLKNDPKYKDTVSNITNYFLRPAAGSQI